MKQIISGKKYDTETATEIGFYSNAGDWRDFHHLVETLYRKRTGEYFLHGEGGPATKYSKSIGQNSWSGGEKIIPLNFEAARKWAEENLDVEVYEAEFGEVSEDESSTSLSISLPANVAESIRAEARQKGITVSAVILSKFVG